MTTANPNRRRVLVTGGAGFIGSNFIRQELVSETEPWELVLCFDKLTYAGNLSNLADLEKHPAFKFIQGDISDSARMSSLLVEDEITAVINFAAESHVDRSIDSPEIFFETNVLGTMRLLESARRYWTGLSPARKELFRFVHVSTDEVFGSLAPGDPPFTEKTAFAPNSPYAASKAAGDHLMRAYFQTYQFPVITGNCSNNYGPYQFPEKLIPFMILNCLEEKPLPVYGDGTQVRDWLHVEDHCRALKLLLENGRLGETYAIGGGDESSNLELVHEICAVLDQEKPRGNGHSYAELIAFVADRPGHDRRYAIDSEKIKRELDWTPRMDFKSGLHQTIRWYLSHETWCREARAKCYGRDQ